MSRASEWKFMPFGETQSHAINNTNIQDSLLVSSAPFLRFFIAATLSWQHYYAFFYERQVVSFIAASFFQFIISPFQSWTLLVVDICTFSSILFSPMEVSPGFHRYFFYFCCLPLEHPGSHVSVALCMITWLTLIGWWLLMQITDDTMCSYVCNIPPYVCDVMTEESVRSSSTTPVVLCIFIFFSIFFQCHQHALEEIYTGVFKGAACLAFCSSSLHIHKWNLAVKCMWHQICSCEEEECQPNCLSVLCTISSY